MILRGFLFGIGLLFFVLALFVALTGVMLLPWLI